MDQTNSSQSLRERLDERNWKLAQHRKQYTRKYYQELSEAKEKGIPVAHTTALIPAELLYSMGIMVCMPENYVTICAAKQMAQRFVEESEKHGYSMHLCSYSRCGMGMMYTEDGPYGKMPDPDVCIGSPIGCDPHTKWFEVAANYYGVPFFNMDGPYNYLGKVEEYEMVLKKTESDKAALKKWEDANKSKIKKLLCAYEAEWKDTREWPKLTPEDGR